MPIVLKIFDIPPLTIQKINFSWVVTSDQNSPNFPGKTPQITKYAKSDITFEFSL